jgi:hypothetical protein
VTTTVLIFTGPETTELSAQEGLAYHRGGEYPRTVPRPRFPALVTLLTLLALVVAACGGGLAIGADRMSSADLTVVADRTAQQRSARLSFDARFEGFPGVSEGLTMSGESEAELSGRRYRTQMDFPLALLGEEGAGESTQTTTLVKDEAVYYLNVPFLTRVLQSPTEWIRMDVLSLPPGSDQLRSLTTGQNDPSQVINFLRGAQGDFRRVGEANLGGVPTTRYRGVIDLDLAAQRAPAEMRERVKASRSELESELGTTRLPTEVWIDDDGLVRQVRYEYPARDSGRGRLVFTTHLSEFGLAVDVAPPPDDEVTDILELLPAGE